jgi:hypothetical protein
VTMFDCAATKCGNGGGEPLETEHNQHDLSEWSKARPARFIKTSQPALIVFAPLSVV